MSTPDQNPLDLPHLPSTYFWRLRRTSVPDPGLLIEIRQKRLLFGSRRDSASYVVRNGEGEMSVTGWAISRTARKLHGVWVEARKRLEAIEGRVGDYPGGPRGVRED